MNNATYVAQTTLGDWRRWREVINTGNTTQIDPNSLLELDLTPGLQNLTVENIQRVATTAAGRIAPDESAARESIASLVGTLTSLREDMRAGVDSQLTELGNLADGLNSSSRQLIGTISNAEDDIPARVLNRAVEDLTNARGELLQVIGSMVGDSTGEVSNLINAITSLSEQTSAMESLSVVSNLVSSYLATGPNRFNDVLSRAMGVFEQFTAGGEIGQVLLQQAPDLLSGVINSFGLDFGSLGPVLEGGLSSIMEIIGPKLEELTNLSNTAPAVLDSIVEEALDAIDPTAVVQTLNSFSPRDTEGTPLQPFAGKLDKAVQVGGRKLEQSFDSDGGLSSEKGKPPNGKSAKNPESYIHGTLPNARVSDFGQDSSTVIDSSTIQVDPSRAKIAPMVEASLKAYPASALQDPAKFNGPILDESAAVKVPRSSVNKGTNFTVFTPQIRRK